jgi:initiation factor 1A
MPPNAKGGKGYRKGKHNGTEEAKMLDWDEKDGQMLGRAMKKLGDRRFRVFCNDNVTRICKLAGSMRKSDWVDEGAIVLIGTRELGNAATGKQQEIGDILSVVDQRIYGKLKKKDGVNPLLFSNVENEEQKDLAKKIQLQEAGEDVDDDLFERGGEEEEIEDIDKDTSLTQEQKEAKKRAREEKQKERDQKIAARRNAKQEDNDDINIDDI